MSEKPTGMKCLVIKESPIESPSPSALAFIAQVEQTYASLMQFASACGASNPGGKLLYSFELDEAGCALAIAGNISGAPGEGEPLQPSA
jgi:hypothetical protein